MNRRRRPLRPTPARQSPRGGRPWARLDGQADLGSCCSLHLDRDEHPHRVVVRYARDLDLLRDDPLDAVAA